MHGMQYKVSNPAWNATLILFAIVGILISLSNSSYTGFEGESLVSVVLVKSGEAQQDTTVIISITDGSAIGQQRTLTFVESL